MAKVMKFKLDIELVSRTQLRWTWAARARVDSVWRVVATGEADGLAQDAWEAAEEGARRYARMCARREVEAQGGTRDFEVRL